MPDVSKGAKTPADHKPKTAPESDVKTATAGGREWEVPAGALDDFELLDDLGQIEQGNPELWDTAMGLNPTGRMATPQEVASAVAFPLQNLCCLRQTSSSSMSRRTIWILLPKKFWKKR